MVHLDLGARFGEKLYSAFSGIGIGTGTGMLRIWMCAWYFAVGVKLVHMRSCGASMGFVYVYDMA